MIVPRGGGVYARDFSAKWESGRGEGRESEPIRERKF